MKIYVKYRAHATKIVIARGSGSTLGPPYERRPYSGSVDGVLGCGA